MADNVASVHPLTLSPDADQVWRVACNYTLQHGFTPPLHVVSRALHKRVGSTLRCELEHKGYIRCLGGPKRGAYAILVWPADIAPTVRADERLCQEVVKAAQRLQADQPNGVWITSVTVVNSVASIGMTYQGAEHLGTIDLTRYRLAVRPTVYAEALAALVDLSFAVRLQVEARARLESRQLG